MKFSTLFSAFTAVAAAPFFWDQPSSPTTRNASACAAYITDQANQMITLTTTLGGIAANAKENDIIGLLKLQTTTQKLINLIKETGQQINSTCGNNNAISINQALGMAGVLLKLPTPINTTMTSLIEKKSTFDHAILYIGNLSWLVKLDLGCVVDSINGMVGAINANLDKSAASLVPQIAGNILKPIQKAQAVYENWL